jgi:hypothetical protein
MPNENIYCYMLDTMNWRPFVIDQHALLDYS